MSSEAKSSETLPRPPQEPVSDNRLEGHRLDSPAVPLVLPVIPPQNNFLPLLTKIDALAKGQTDRLRRHGLPHLEGQS
jgi:hypothetical protein